MLTIACGNSEKSKGESSSSPILKSDIESPCEILSEAEIKDVLEIPSDAETTMNEKDTTFPVCFYKWKSITFPSTMKMGSIEKTLDYPAELSIVLVKNASENKFNTSVSIYDDGENQDDVAEMAVWSPKKAQLTFLSGDYLIHVHVRTTADVAANRAKAVQVAKMIVNKI